MNRCEDLTDMTEQAHSAGNLAPNDENAVNPPAEGMDPGDRPVDRTALPVEIGGRQGLEPTRYGDWELRGRCIDF